jgi:glycosyltransferase involved in cell wall biosynthesis
MLPLVSLVTPTYNRRRFIPSLIRCIEQQTYPKDRIEWIILDDGQDLVGDLFKQCSLKVTYIYSHEKLTIGEKRNKLNELAKGDIIVAIDDDDFYFPERVMSAVTSLNSNPTIDLAGSSEVYMYFTKSKEIYKAGPYFQGHATNGTMAWRKRYALSRSYDETVVFAEEKSFLEDYKNPLVQLNPMQCMLVICHKDNTFDKTNLLKDKTNPFMKKTTLSLKDFIKDEILRNFYESF